MPLTDQERTEIRNQVGLDYSRGRVPKGMTIEEFRMVVDDIDDWIDANIQNFMGSIREPGASKLNNKEKLKIFLYVVDRRWEVA